MIRFKERFINSKIYLQRSLSYMALANGGMIFFLFVDKINEFGFSISLKKYFIPLVCTGFIVMYFIGWLETKLGGLEAEFKQSNDHNPYMTDMIKRLERIEESMKIIIKCKDGVVQSRLINPDNLEKLKEKYDGLEVVE